MITKTYYLEYENKKDGNVIGKSFRVETLMFWESIPDMIEKHLKYIENKFDCTSYLINIKRVD